MRQLSFGGGGSINIYNGGVAGIIIYRREKEKKESEENTLKEEGEKA